METEISLNDCEKNLKVVFTYNPFDAEKIGLICERDRLFQQYIDLIKSIEAWDKKLPKKGKDADEDYNLRRNRRRVLDNLEMNKKLITIELLKLDEEISPCKLVADENN
jgi:hypothetical protein